MSGIRLAQLAKLNPTIKKKAATAAPVGPIGNSSGIHGCKDAVKFTICPFFMRQPAQIRQLSAFRLYLRSDKRPWSMVHSL